MLCNKEDSQQGQPAKQVMHDRNTDLLKAPVGEERISRALWSTALAHQTEPRSRDSNLKALCKTPRSWDNVTNYNSASPRIYRKGVIFTAVPKNQQSVVVIREQDNVT